VSLSTFLTEASASARGRKASPRPRFAERAAVVGAVYSREVEPKSREQKRSMLTFAAQTRSEELLELARLANEDYLLIAGIFGNASDPSESDLARVREARAMFHALYAFACFLGGYRGAGIRSPYARSVTKEAAALSRAMESNVIALNDLFTDHDLPPIPLGGRP
jgi:hypothetical protein